MFISKKSCLKTVTRIKMESDEAGHSGQFSLFQVFKLCLFREPTSCIQTVTLLRILLDSTFYNDSAGIIIDE